MAFITEAFIYRASSSSVNGCKYFFGVLSFSGSSCHPTDSILPLSEYVKKVGLLSADDFCEIWDRSFTPFLYAGRDNVQQAWLPNLSKVVLLLTDLKGNHLSMTYVNFCRMMMRVYKFNVC